MGKVMFRVGIFLSAEVYFVDFLLYDIVQTCEVYNVCG